MEITSQKAWDKASKLIALCLGFKGSQKRKIRKVSQQYNEATGHHEILLKLEIKNKVPDLMQRVVYEYSDDSYSLIREINDNVITDDDFNNTF